MDMSNRRIVILGKTGVGKSSVANTIFGEKVFDIGHTLNSDTKKCQAETKSINGRNITLVDTPGFFDTDLSEEKLKPEIVRCITECAPGPHAFLILLKVERYTEHEQAVIKKINQYFSEEVFKYVTVLFTHGDQLPEGQTIEKFVRDNKLVRDLVKKCGGRCHVVDNKYWKNNQQEEYRSNQVQVEELLKAIDKMVEANEGRCYTNEMLQIVEKEIQREEEVIKQNMSGNMPWEEIRKQAKTRVSKRLLIQLAGTATGVVFGAFLGLAGMVGIIVTAVQNVAAVMKLVKTLPALGGAAAVPAAGGAAAAAVGGAAAVPALGDAAVVPAVEGAAVIPALGGAAAAAAVGGAAVTAAGGEIAAGLAVSGTVLGVTAAAFAAGGGVIGGIIGNEASEGAKTVQEAVEMAANAVINKAKCSLKPD